MITKKTTKDRTPMMGSHYVIKCVEACQAMVRAYDDNRVLYNRCMLMPMLQGMLKHPLMHPMADADVDKVIKEVLIAVNVRRNEAHAVRIKVDVDNVTATAILCTVLQHTAHRKSNDVLLIKRVLHEILSDNVTRNLHKE